MRVMGSRCASNHRRSIAEPCLLPLTKRLIGRSPVRPAACIAAIPDGHEPLAEQPADAAGTLDCPVSGTMPLRGLGPQRPAVNLAVATGL